MSSIFNSLIQGKSVRRQLDMLRCIPDITGFWSFWGSLWTFCTVSTYLCQPETQWKRYER